MPGSRGSKHITWAGKWATTCERLAEKLWPWWRKFVANRSSVNNGVTKKSYHRWGASSRARTTGQQGHGEARLPIMFE